MFKYQGRISVALGLVFFLMSSSASASKSVSAHVKRPKGDIKLTVLPWGPTEKETAAAKARVEKSPQVQAKLNGTKYRLLEFGYLENLKSGVSQPPVRYRIAFYDYSNDRVIIAVGDFAGRDPIAVTEEYYQPTPTDDEFAEAVSILQNDVDFRDALKSGALKAYQPMPDVTVLNGTMERLVNVGVAGGDKNEIVSVSIMRDKVIRYPSGAPSTSRAAPDACGIPTAGQTTTSNGTAGQATLTVSDGVTTYWEMLIIRPSASSGTRKSGIEVQNVKYKGKSVLKRGHAPVLNVQYVPQSCGPYRDWQWQEDMFATPASGNSDIAPGIRLLAAGQVATTALETGDDTGNFRGVAIYQQGNDTVLVSEMQAGWYRYIMEWRFNLDGTIRPRYGFGATANNCVCNVHNHHVYWRFDFDIVQPNNKVFQVERGRKFLKPIATEMFANKNTQTNRGIVIQNSAGNEAYELIPNLSDGLVDTFGVHDLWILRYKNVVGGTPVQNEIDDGFNQTTSSNAFIQIDPFVNGESTFDQDVVVWYGAHFVHSDGGNLINPNRSGLVLTGDHVVGPDLRPIQW